LVPMRTSQRKMAVTVEENSDTTRAASENTSDEFQSAAQIDEAIRQAKEFLRTSEDPEYRKKVLEYEEDPTTGAFSIGYGRQFSFIPD
jgi:hypothetical protein